MKKSSKIMLGSALLLATIMVVVAAAWGHENASTASAYSPQDVALYSEYTNLPLLYNNYVFNPNPNIFGVQMPGNTGPSSPYYDLMVGSEASWIRVPIAWYLIEPQPLNPSQYNWNSADTFTQAARPDNGGMNLIVTISGNPDWAAESRQGPLYEPIGVNHYVDFIAAAAERYDGDGYNDAPGSPVVNYWEIYNEPDRGLGNTGPSKMGWGDDGDKYAALLQAIYPVVRAANPNAKIVMGGLAYDWFEDQGGPHVREFLDDVLTAGGGDYFDVMNYHVYPIFWRSWVYPESPGLLEKTIFIKNKLASYGYPNKPILITEASWHSNDTPVAPSSPETQARYVVELSTQALAAGAETMVWWQLHDPTDAWPYMNGLVTTVDNPSPLDPKPSYLAFQTAIKEYGTADFHRILSDAETGSNQMEAYEFHDSLRRRTVYVAWMDPIETTEVRKLRVPATVAIVRTIYDSSHVVTDGQDGINDGLVTVNVGGQPVYIEVGW